MRADVHMHSAFSFDSSADMERMIESAIQKGLHLICFTDHYDKDCFYNGEEQIFDTEKYIETISVYREKYEGKIQINAGVELGLQPHLEEYFREYTKKYPFDQVIGSVHTVRGEDPAVGSMFEEYGDDEVYRITFEEMLEDVRKIEDFDVLGHIDYVVRYAKGGSAGYSWKKYEDLIEAILKELISTGRGIEVNMAGLRFGLPFAHPYPEILKRYRELGGEIITVGADGHRPEQIAYDFHLADGILKEAGFKYYTEFFGRKPAFKKLAD